MKIKKFMLLIVGGLTAVSMLCACGKSEVPETAAEVVASVNPGSVDSLPEGSIIVQANEIGADKENANEYGWVNAKMYIDTMQKLYDESKDEYFKVILDNASNDVADAHLLLGIKYEDDATTYAYEAIEKESNATIVMYVTVKNDGTVDVTTDTTDVEDQILLNKTVTSDDTDTTDTDETTDETTTEDTVEDGHAEDPESTNDEASVSGALNAFGVAGVEVFFNM